MENIYNEIERITPRKFVTNPQAQATVSSTHTAILIGPFVKLHLP